MSAAADLLAAAARATREGRSDEAAELYRRILAAQPDHAEALRGLGALEFQAGRYDAAERHTRLLLKVRPGDPAIHYALGLVLQRLGRSEEATAAYDSALALDPLHARTLIALGELYWTQGRLDAAVVAARKAAAIEPTSGEACNLLGAVLEARGDTREAVLWFERATIHQPDNARAHYNLGVGLEALRRTDEALAAYRRAAQIDPTLMEARNNLGLLLVDAEEGVAAIAHLQAAVELAPGSAVAHNNLGRALYGAGRLDEARTRFERALQIAPDYAEALANTGAVERSLGRLEAALASLDRAVRLKPDLADAHANRSAVLRDLGRLDEAADSALRAVAARPDQAKFHTALALVHNDRGFHRDALASCRRAIELDPGSVTAHRTLLGLLLYNPGPSAAARFVECRAFGRQFGRQPVARPEFADRLHDPERRLRIGYVSSDLRGEHPIARNLRPIFAHHDRTRFEIFVYAELSAPDRTTDEFRQRADGWRSIEGINDADVAATIRDDRIDILVLLAGRFDRNRPLLACYRPAPVQVSFHDPATSGLDEMDYLIADRILAPAEGGERFTERVARLPHFYVHEPLQAVPPVGPLPMAGQGVPTFGCCNNPAKLTDESLAAWARVLQAVPGARLLLKFRNWYGSGRLRQRVTAALTGAGIAADRLTMIEADEPGTHHLDVYNRIDVALDPFPFTGSTTTFESLWMGVPVVTLAGETMVSRWTSSMLSAVDLAHLAAPTSDAYVSAAVEAVADPVRLATLRAGLRARVAASPLCDGRGRTRQIERLYRAFWRRACGAVARAGG